MFPTKLFSIKRAVFCLCYAGILLATFHAVRTNFHGDKLLEQREERELYANHAHSAVETNRVQDDWTCIRKDFCLYSAHYDNTTIGRPAVRVFGVAGQSKSVTVFVSCQYIGANGTLSKRIPGDAKGMPSEDPNHAVFSILCKLDGKWDKVRIVSMDSLLEAKESDPVSIHYPPPVYMYQVAICVKPFHSGYNNTIRLLEWIEYHKMLGVQHFTFYNYSTMPEVGLVLNSYDHNIVTILPWGLDMGENDIVSYGQFLSCTECPHRHRGVTKYLIAIDVDELLALPSMFNSFYEYLEHLWNDAESHTGKTINSLVFRSRSSFNNWEPDESGHLLGKIQKGPRLLNVLKGMAIPFRTRYLSANQTKFVMKPDLITNSGIHHIGEGTANSADVGVPLHKGYYLHVRDCEPYYHVPNRVLLNNATCLQTTGIQRDTYLADRFGLDLLRSVAEKIETTATLRRLYDQY